MSVAWERIAIVLVTGAAWMLILMAGTHLAHAMRNPPRLIAHAGQSRRREQG